jgi:hypothetical protein
MPATSPDQPAPRRSVSHLLPILDGLLAPLFRGDSEPELRAGFEALRLRSTVG